MARASVTAHAASITTATTNATYPHRQPLTHPNKPQSLPVTAIPSAATAATKKATQSTPAAGCS